MKWYNPLTWFSKEESTKQKKKVFLTKEQVDIAYKIAIEQHLSPSDIASAFNVSIQTASTIIAKKHIHQTEKEEPTVSYKEEPTEIPQPEKIKQSAPKSQRKAAVRKKQNNIHLKKEEVAEIESMHPNFNKTSIQSTYNISYGTTIRIINGTHPKTSEAYKTLLLKLALSK